MKLTALCLHALALLSFVVLSQVPGHAQSPSVIFADDFSQPELAPRKAQRGPWQIKEGIARCTQDDALYAKFKQHGPIIFYEVPHQDMTVSFSFKAEAAKQVVFTCNGEHGHVFRIVLGAMGGSMRAFPADAKDHKSIVLGMADKTPLPQGQWVPVTITLKGGTAVAKIGAVELRGEHASVAGAKVNMSFGFSFGTVSVKDWKVVKA